MRPPDAAWWAVVLLVVFPLARVGGFRINAAQCGYYSPTDSGAGVNTLKFGPGYDTIVTFDYDNNVRQNTVGSYAINSFLNMKGCSYPPGSPPNLVFTGYLEVEARPLNSASDTWATRPQNTSNFQLLGAFTSLAQGSFNALEMTNVVRYLSAKGPGSVAVVHMTATTNFSCANPAITFDVSSFTSMLPSPATCASCLQRCYAQNGLCLWCTNTPTATTGVCVDGDVNYGPFLGDPATCPYKWYKCLPSFNGGQAVVVPAARSTWVTSGQTVSPSLATDGSASVLWLNGEVPAPRTASTYLWFDDLGLNSSMRNMTFRYNVPSEGVSCNLPYSYINVHLFLVGDSSSFSENMVSPGNSNELDLGPPYEIVLDGLCSKNLVWDVSWIAKYAKPPLLFRISGPPGTGESSPNYAAPSTRSPFKSSAPNIFADTSTPSLVPLPLPDLSGLDASCALCRFNCSAPLGGCRFNTTTGECEEVTGGVTITCVSSDTAAIRGQSLSFTQSITIPNFNNAAKVYYYRFDLTVVGPGDVGRAVFRVYRWLKTGVVKRGLFWFQPPDSLTFAQVTAQTFTAYPFTLLYGVDVDVPALDNYDVDVTWPVRQIKQQEGTCIWLALIIYNDDTFIDGPFQALKQAEPTLWTFMQPSPDVSTFSASCSGCIDGCEISTPSAGCGWCGQTSTCAMGNPTGPFNGVCPGGWSFASCPMDASGGNTFGTVPVQDAVMVSGAAPNTSYSDSPFLSVSALRSTMVYFRVNISAVQAYSNSGGTLGAITLELASNAGPLMSVGNLNANIFQMAFNIFTAEGMNYNNQPCLPRRLLSKKAGVQCPSNRLSCRTAWDVRDAVYQALSAGDQLVSFVIVPTGNSSTLFHGNNQTLMPQWRPRLKVSFVPAADPCNANRNCSECLAAAGSCGWCDSTQNCRYGDATGRLSRCPQYKAAWYYNSCPLNYAGVQPSKNTVVGPGIFAFSYTLTNTPLAPSAYNTCPLPTDPDQAYEIWSLSLVASPTCAKVKALYNVSALQQLNLTSIDRVVNVLPSSPGYIDPQAWDAMTYSPMVSTYTDTTGLQLASAFGSYAQRQWRFSSFKLNVSIGGTLWGDFLASAAGGVWIDQPMQADLFNVRTTRVIIDVTANLSPPNCAVFDSPCECLTTPGCLWCAISNTSSASSCILQGGNCSLAYSYLETCPAGQYGPYGMYLPLVNDSSCYCTPCTAGSYQASTTACAQCAPGNFSGDGADRCTACDPGYYAADYGAATCTQCPAGTFTNHSGSPSCDQCPAGSASDAGATACTPCTPNFYQPQPGQPSCLDCPTGSKCEGEGLVTVTGLKEGYGGCCGVPVLPCGVKAACPGGTCPQCPAYLCNPGYTGQYCETCQKTPEPFRRVSGGTCEACPKLAVLLIVVAIILIAVLCAILLKYGRTISNHLTSLSIGLGFTQSVGLFKNFNFTLPPAIDEYLKVLTVTNLGADFINTECAFPALTFVAGFALRLLLPIIVLLIFVIIYASVKLHAFVVKRTVVNFRTRHQHFVRERDASLRGLAAAREWVRWQAVRFTTKYRTSLELSKLKSKIINAYITFLALAYLFTSQTALEVFACVDVNGELKIASDVSQPCSGATYDTMVAVAGVALAVYTAGLPIIFAVILLSNRIYAQLEDEKFMSRYGMLFSRYKAGRFYWEVGIMLRKFAIVACAVFAPVMKPTYGTAIILIVIFVFTIGLQIWGKPFRFVQHNLLEASLQILFVLALITGASASTGGNTDVMSVFLFIFLSIGIVVILIILAYDVVGAIRRRVLRSSSDAACLQRLCGGVAGEDEGADAADGDDSLASIGQRSDKSRDVELPELKGKPASGSESLRGKTLPPTPPPGARSPSVTERPAINPDSFAAPPPTPPPASKKALPPDPIEDAGNNPVFEG